MRAGQIYTINTIRLHAVERIVPDAQTGRISHDHQAVGFLLPDDASEQADEKATAECIKLMLTELSGLARERLQRLAMLMNESVHWDKCKSRTDLITALHRGEMKVVC